MKILYKFFVLLYSIFLVSNHNLISQTYLDANIYSDNGKASKLFNQAGFEEICLLDVAGPCKLKNVYVYLTGTTSRQDTLRLIGDPGDHGLPATYWVSGFLTYNTYAQFIINYSGTQGWYKLSMGSTDLYYGGKDRIGLSHLIKSGGPSIAIDANAVQAIKGYSYVVDVFKPNPNFYNIPGTLIYSAGGNFLVRYEVEYLYPSQSGSQSPPTPAMVDVTNSANIKDAQGALINADMASIFDWNNDNYEDIAIGSNFLQNNGDGTFTNVSNKFNISAFATIWGDLDNDGISDIFAANAWGNDKIYWGNANGNYTEETDAVLKVNAPTVTPLFLDYDNDGLIDIFIAYGRKEENGNETYYPDKLFKNLGNRKFKETTVESGITASEASNARDCWGASVCDFNVDGKPDIFVATYRLAPDFLYMNNGDGTFSEIGAASGIQGNPTAVAGYFGHGMGSDWGDFDNNGQPDLVVGNLGHPDQRGAYSNPSLIFSNKGDGVFNEVHQEMGLKFFEMNAGATWLDINNDGFLDLFSCQYAYYRKGDQNQADKLSRLYLNQGIAKNFRLKDITWETGALIHGAWTPIKFDFDNDGDLDLLVCSAQENVKLFRNEIVKYTNWIEFDLKGDVNQKVNNQAYGTNIKLSTKDGYTYLQQLSGNISTGRASQSSNRIHFGLNTELSNILQVEFTYSNGEKFAFAPPLLNKIYKINYKQAISSIDGEENYNKVEIELLENQNKLLVKSNELKFKSIQIFDIKGNLILSENNFDLSNETLIDISKLSNGFYNVCFDESNQKLSNKFVIAR